MKGPERCPGCGSENLVTTTEGVPEPHHAKLACGDCGRHIKWLPGPASGFRMPFGHHEGKTLAEIDAAGCRAYLQWIADRTDYGNAKVRDRVIEYLSPADMPLPG